MSKTLSKAVADSVAKTLAAGGARVTLTLNPEEAALWRRVLKRFPGRGGQKAAFLAALAALEDKPKLTKAELLAELERRLR